MVVPAPLNITLNAMALQASPSSYQAGSVFIGCWSQLPVAWGRYDDIDLPAVDLLENIAWHKD